MLRHYVEFVYPGIMVSETSSKWVVERGIPVKMPAKAFGYRFYDQEQEVSESGELLTGKPKNYSGWHYEGRRMSFSEVVSKFSDQRVLITHMRRGGYKEIVYTKHGQFIPLNPEDKILGEELVGQVVFFAEPFDTGRLIKPGTPVFDRPGGKHKIGEVMAVDVDSAMGIDYIRVQAKITDPEITKKLTSDNCKNFSVGGTTSGSVRKRAVPKVR